MKKDTGISNTSLALVQQTVKALEPIRNSLANKSPSRANTIAFLHNTLGSLFPHLADGTETKLDDLVKALAVDLSDLVSSLPNTELALVDKFLETLPALQKTLLDDAKAILAGDPAAKNIDEVILAYPGFFAIAAYRIAHVLHNFAIPTIPRMITEYAHQKTGIDIHPGAKIGRAVVIDHGTGIVIGETSVIHDNVKLYQGVTLGALSVEKQLADVKRHPTIEEGVVIYANATILGGDTVVGAGSIIGGNVWLTASVPAGTTVYHKEDLSVRKPGG